MINLDLHQLPFKWKVILSSAITGTILYLGMGYTNDLPEHERNFLEIDIQVWVWGLYYGLMLAWSEVWKKDIKSAFIHFAIGIGLYLPLYGSTTLLSAPVNSAINFALHLIPFVPILTFIKLVLAQGKAAISRKMLTEVYLSRFIGSIVLLYIPALLLGELMMYANTRSLLYFIDAPVFYLIFYRISEGKEWKNLIQVNTISKVKFVVLFFASWSALLLSFFRFPDWINLHIRMLNREDTSSFLLEVFSCLHLPLAMLTLGYLCIKLLACWHFTIKKPLGWLYLLSFVPLVNIFTIAKLVKDKNADSWGASTVWLEYLEDGRKKFATNLVVLTIVGSLIYVVYAMDRPKFYQEEDNLYISLMASTLSVINIYAFYKGWLKFWMIATAYALLYALFLSMDVPIDLESVAVSLTTHCLGLLIYYEAIRPSANKTLQQQLMAA